MKLRRNIEIRSLERQRDAAALVEIARNHPGTSNAKLRRRIVQSLSTIDGDDATSALIEFLANDDDVLSRALAATGLSGRRSDAVADSLSNALCDGDEMVRAAAAKSLKDSGSARSLQALTEVLSDPSDGLRARVVDAIGHIGTEAAIEPLILALEDSEAYIRASAAGYLGGIGGETAINSLKQQAPKEKLFYRGVFAEAIREAEKGVPDGS